MARVLALLLLFYATPVFPGSPFALPYFETVPGTERISNGIITAVTQDTRGLIWLGSTEGLLSYDGYQLRRYRYAKDDLSTLGDDYVRSLLAHSDGRLWIATQAAGLSIYDPLEDRFERLAIGTEKCQLPSAAAVAMVEGASGEVWIGLGNSGLARWNPSSGCIDHYPPNPELAGGITHDTVRALLLDRHGTLWLGTGNGLQRKRPDSEFFDRVISDSDDPDSFDRQYVYGLMEASDGRIWIATQTNGAAVYDPATGTLIRLPAGEQPNQVSHPWVSGFIEARAGEIWVFTFGGGIDVITASTNRVKQRIRSDLSVPGGLSLDRLITPYQDASGLIWIGTWGGGLQRHNPYNGEAFATLRANAMETNGLRSADIFSTLPAGPRRLWIGTDRGLDLFDLDQGLVQSYPPAPEQPGGLLDGTVRALTYTTDGNLWVGTQQAGLQRFRPEGNDFSEAVAGLRRGPVRRLLGASDDRLWIGLQAGLARMESDQTELSMLRYADGTAFSDAVWSLAEDSAKRIWVSTPNSLLLWRPEHDYLVPIESSAPLRAATDLQIGADGNLWCSGPRGIAKLVGWEGDTPIFADYGQRFGELPQGFGQQLLFDNSGRLWGPTGVIDIDAETLDEIGVADGVDIGSVSAGAGSRFDSGILVFGGTRGLLVIDPAHYQRWSYEPTLLTTGVEIDGKSHWLGDPAKGIVLRADQSRVSVSFAGLDYSAPTELGYAYRLLGLDEHWTEVGSDRRIATYNNLWPKDYGLQLRVRNREGQWGEALQVPLRVQPSLWQTPWALLLAVFSLMLIGYTLIRWRTLRIDRQAQGLQALVAQRTSELQGAKDHAELALRELQGAQEQLVVAEKMASLGQLVAGVAHEINTPIGIAVTAASHLDEVSRRSGEKLRRNELTRSALQSWKAEVEEGTKLILRSLDRAAALVASFKQVSVDQSSDQRRQFEVAAYLEEVRLALQPMVRRTRHEFTVDCDSAVSVDTYPGAIFQILTNLLANAIHHAYSEGQHGRIRLSAQSENDRLVLRFDDDGHGMQANVRNHAFDPFFTTRRGSGGSGLGLHIVHNLVTQLLGGRIELKSEPAQGTHFTIHIPKTAPKAKPT